MSDGTHRQLQREAVEKAIQPMRAAACAVQYLEHPDYEANRATLAALQKASKVYEVRAAIDEKVKPLSTTTSWSDTDRCAAIVLSFPPIKAAARESARATSN